MSLLTVEGLSLSRGKRRLIGDLSFTLPAGAMVGLVGPNGAGKTSLLRALVGVLPHEGQILLDHRPLALLTPRERARQIGYLSQEQACHWAISVETLVGLGLLPQRSPFRADGPAEHAAVAAALAEFGLEPLRQRTLPSLSGGERARALLARALVGRPRLLLADEPVAALDPGQQLRVMAALRRRVEAGLTVLIVLHDLSLAARCCDRLLLLDQGRLRAEGPPAEVLQSEAAAESYGVAFALGEVGGAPSVQARLR